MYPISMISHFPAFSFSSSVGLHIHKVEYVFPECFSSCCTWKYVCMLCILPSATLNSVVHIFLHLNIPSLCYVCNISWSALILCLLHVCMVIVVNFRTNTCILSRIYILYIPPQHFMYYIINILYIPPQHFMYYIIIIA